MEAEGEGGSERGGSTGIDIGKGEGGLGAGLATGGVSRGKTLLPNCIMVVHSQSAVPQCPSVLGVPKSSPLSP